MVRCLRRYNKRKIKEEVFIIKKAKISINILLIVQFILLLFGNFLLKFFLPTGAINILIVVITYFIWLYQVLIGRKNGCTSGISSTLLVVILLWPILLSLKGYEYILVPPMISTYLPRLMLFVSVILAIFEFKQLSSSELGEFKFEKSYLSTSIVILVPIFAYFSGRVPRMTLGYVDQGISINYFSSGFLLFLTIPTISLILLSLINYIKLRNASVAKSRKIASLGLLISLAIFAVVAFIAPFIFWIGINPIIFTAIFLFCLGLTPMYGRRS